MFQDKTLVCKDCGSDFTFTVGEQEFYEEKGFQNEPARCKDCRNQKKASVGGGGRRAGGNSGRREMHDAICAECGSSTQVPFEPKNDRPIYCSDCYQARR